MLITSDGTDKPIEFEPREVLARVLQRLAKRGIRPVVAFELEFYLFDRKLDNGLPQYPRDTATDDADDQPNMHIERLSRFVGAARWSMAPTSRACRRTSSPQSWAPASSRSTSATATTPCARPTGRRCSAAAPAVSR
jgi:hypothetical protein